jgi:tRNA threonylcarbamoyl adenosine modification protein (Sua5/YciO/YrdC/YwlC family)
MSTNGATTTRAKIVPLSEIKECGERLREGHLVAFPTETVYGLGCHALDTTAVARVFCAKERPTSDPLIVHVTTSQQALDLWDVREEETRSCLQTLMDTFWPGPLTLVAKANDTIIPPLLTADTGFVACRSPSHSIAQLLLEAARVPIAAPSANKFGHVSPTRASHVWDDLSYEDVWILESAAAEEENTCCDVGVESTVVKLEWNDSTQQGTVVLLRHGAISASSLQKAISGVWNVSVQPKHTSETTPNVAPGQSIRHYSPHVDCYMISSDKNSVQKDELPILSQAVVLDYAGQLNYLQNQCLAYRDLSVAGNSQEASASLFQTLRWAETVPSATRVYVPQLTYLLQDNDNALLWAIQDRLTRAASGVIIDNLK